MSLSSTSQASQSESPIQFIETTRYQRPTLSGDLSSIPPPEPWKEYEHPNGDIYFYNPLLRLITPEDIRDPIMLRFVLEAREDHLQCLRDDSSLDKLEDDWELTLSDVTDTVAVIGMCSRKLGASYNWTEERGLEFRSPEYFWSHVAEYPSHHEELPPNTEAAFIQALNSAKTRVTQGEIFPFSATQIDQVIRKYKHLKTLQVQGRNVTPALAWLMGVVMPLDPCGKTYTERILEELMEQMHV